MTCIVGLIEDGTTWMGGDRLASQGWQTRILSKAKIFKNKSMIIGVTGALELAQIMRYSFRPPAQGQTGTDVYMNTVFINALKKCLKKQGFSLKDKEKVSFEGGIIIAYKGRLFTVDGFCVCETVEGFASVGCGKEYALGSMNSTKNRDPKKRVMAALQAAERFSAFVRAPFDILSIDKNGKVKEK